MKKILFRCSFIAIMALTTVNANAQFFLGGGLSFNNYFGGTGLRFPGLTLLGEKSLDDNALRFTINVGLPTKIERTFDLYENGTGNYAMDVDGHEKYSFLNFGLDFKYYFGRGDSEDGGIYVAGGAGLTMISASYMLEDYNTSAYYTNYDYTVKERFFQPILRVGFGGEFELGFGNMFIEPFLTIPANQVNGAYISINIPPSAGLLAGIKIPL